MTEMSDTMKQMKDICDGICDKLEAFHEGLVYDTETGEMAKFSPRDDSDGDDDEDRYEGLYEYLMDNLGIKAVMDLPVTDSDNLVGCIITMVWGGPNIYIDTYTMRVEGYWGTEHYETYLPRYICDEIDDIVRDLLTC